MKDDELAELQNPENWDWDEAVAFPGVTRERRDAMLRERYGIQHITWSENVAMYGIRLSAGG